MNWVRKIYHRGMTIDGNSLYPHCSYNSSTWSDVKPVTSLSTAGAAAPPFSEERWSFVIKDSLAGSFEVDLELDLDFDLFLVMFNSLCSYQAEGNDYSVVY